jgi:O-antigen/teichoic acid export membrane protein
MAAEESRTLRVGRNTLFLLSTDVAARLFSWAALAYLWRQWPVETYGQFALVKNLVAIFATASDLGLNALTIREVAFRKDMAGFYLRNVMGLRFWFSLLLITLLLLTGLVFGYEKSLQWGLAVMGLRLLFDCTSGAYVYLLQAHERMGIHGSILSLASLFRLVGTVGVAAWGGGLVQVCGVWVATSAATLAVLVAIGLRNGWKPDFSLWNPGEAMKVLRSALPLAAFGAFQMLYYRVDSVLLKSLKGNGSVGLYDAAATFLLVVLSFSQHFGLSTFPVFSRDQNQPPEFARLARRSLKFLVVMGLPISLGGYLLAGPLMGLVAGAKYLTSAPSFSILALSAVPFFISNLYVNILMVRKPKFLVGLYLFLFILNVILNLFLIPRWDTVGAAWATVLCELAGMVLGLGMTWKDLRADKSGRYLWTLCAALIAAMIMGWGIERDPRLYWLALGPVVYGLAYWILGGLEREDWQALQGFMGRPKG